MTASDFYYYHNVHIKFRLKNGRELSGVLFDSVNSHETEKPRTVYTYIATGDMIGWKGAERSRDKEKMKSLEQEIDLEDIVWVERLNY